MVLTVEIIEEAIELVKSDNELGKQEKDGSLAILNWAKAGLLRDAEHESQRWTESEIYKSIHRMEKIEGIRQRQGETKGTYNWLCWMRDMLEIKGLDTSRLTPEVVNLILMDCLFREHEIRDGKVIDQSKMVAVEGIVRTYGLHIGRLESHRGEICDLLRLLPSQFFIDGGGGWSFLHACDDKYGNLWGQHHDMESLFVLGIGLGIVEWQMKDMLRHINGGMPFVRINLRCKGFGWE